jgi:WD40 repeat protein
MKVAPPRVPEHEVLRPIGLGAYGEVWLARNATGIPRAVKVVRRERFEHDRIYEREFEGLKRFEPVSRAHAGLVDVLQVGRSDADGYFYYVMELADPAGPDGVFDPESYVPLTLREWLRSTRGPLPVVACARVGSAVADALAFLHERGLVHRDVKPSNIIFVAGQPKLADVGLVTGMDEARSFVGTEGYIAPEGPGSARADVYALGKVLYEMVTGRSRLDFPDLPGEWLHRPPPEHFGEFNELMLRACAPVARDRHRSAAELRDELLLLEAGHSVRGWRRRERLLGRWRRIGAGLAVAGLMAAGVAWFQRGQVEAANRRAAAEAALRERATAQERAARAALYAADLNLAQQALAAGNFGRAEALLEAHRPRAGEPDVRGFEWFHFREQARGMSLGVLTGHEKVVTALAVSADGQRLFSASFDGTVREWSLESLRETRQWAWPGSLVAGMSADASGRRLAFELDRPPQTVVLDLEAGQWICGPGRGSPGTVFSPEGDRLLRGVGMILFKTNAVTEILGADLQGPARVLAESGGRAWFSPAGRLLVTGPWGNALRLWSWPELVALGDLPDAGTVMAVAFHPDARRLAAVSRQGRLTVWEIETRRRLKEQTAHGGGVIWSVAFSPDGLRLATAGNDQTVRVWNADTLKELQTLRGHRSEVWAVVWTPDGRRLLSGGKDASIRLWASDPQPPGRAWTGLVQAPEFSPDERWLAVRLKDRGVVLLDPASGDEHRALGPAVELGGFSADGAAVSLLNSQWAVEWRATDDGRLLRASVVGAEPAGVTARRLSASGRWLVLGTGPGEIRVRDTLAGDPPRRLDGHRQAVISLEFSRDERRLLSGARDQTARLWELETGRELAVFPGHRMAVSALAFAPEGGRIATGSWDDTVRLWETATGAEVAAYADHPAAVHAVAFAPDGRTLAVLSGSGELRFWHLAIGRRRG